MSINFKGAEQGRAEEFKESLVWVVGGCGGHLRFPKEVTINLQRRLPTLCCSISDKAHHERQKYFCDARRMHAGPLIQIKDAAADLS
jgi:hypothetical protein